MLLEGTQVYVGPFLKRSDRPLDKAQRYTNVYVKNLAETVTEDMLEKLFSESGQLNSVIIMKVRPLQYAVMSLASWQQVVLHRWGLQGHLSLPISKHRRPSG